MEKSELRLRWETSEEIQKIKNLLAKEVNWAAILGLNIITVTREDLNRLAATTVEEIL